MPNDEERLTISELANAAGTTTYTLRYYERVDLIPLVERTEAGHRRYRPDHVDWLRLLGRLRASGMSIQMMKAYTELVVEGRDNLDERRHLLRHHLSEIDAQIEELREAERVIRSKLDFYDQLEQDGDAAWTYPD